MESWARAWRTLVRGWPAPAALAVLGAVLGWLVSSWSPSSYKAEARIFFRASPFPIAPEEFPPPLADAWSRGTAASLILADAVLERAVREGLREYLPSSTPAELAESTQTLRSRLSVHPEGDGTALLVSCTDGSPKRAAAMAAAVARSYEPAAAELLRRGIGGAASFLEAALRERDREFRRVEKEFLDLGPETLEGFERAEKSLRKEVEDLEGTLAAARLESASLAVELDLLMERMDRGEFGPLPPPVVSEAEAPARDLEAARRDLDRLRAERPEDAPAIAAASDRVEQLRRRRAEAMERELRKTRFAPVRSLLDQIREKTARREHLLSAARDLQIRLDKARQRLKEHLESTPAEARAEARERALKRRRLEDERTRLEVSLRNLKDRKDRIEAAAAALVNPVDRLETAAAAVPLYGNPFRGLPWGALGGALLGIPLAWSLGRTTRVLRTETDVRRIVNLPLLGCVPQAEEESPALVQSPPESGLSETWQSIATLLEGLARRAEAKILLVTSPGAGEGKSTAAGNLAVALSRAGAKTLLLDADLRRPVQHQVFGVAEEWSQAGLSAFLQGSAETAESVTAPTGIETLGLLPAGPYPGPTAPLLRSKRLEELAASVREKYEYVVVDAPPVSGSADALLLAPRADAVLLVLASGETRKDEVTEAKRLLREAGARILGCLLNKASDRSPGYYSYSPYTPAEAPQG